MHKSMNIKCDSLCAQFALTNSDFVRYVGWERQGVISAPHKASLKSQLTLTLEPVDPIILYELCIITFHTMNL